MRRRIRAWVVGTTLACAVVVPGPLAGQADGEGRGVNDLRGIQASSHAPEIEEAWAELEAWLRGRLETQGIVGGSVYLVRRGEILGRLHHGLSDVDAHRKVDARTVFHWASITKTLTAVAFMQLRDRGMVSLNDPLVRWIPELEEVHNPFGPMEAITFRHALSHSSGFRAATWPWGGHEPWHPFEPTRWEQLAAMMPYTRIHFPPGTRFAYSNPAYVFVGETIERISGEPYEIYVEKEILEPLGMESAYFDRTPEHLLPHRSNHYVVEDGVPRPGGLDFDTGITVSNGGLNASLPDMVRWLRFLAGPGTAGERSGVAGEEGEGEGEERGMEGRGGDVGGPGIGRGTLREDAASEGGDGANGGDGRSGGDGRGESGGAGTEESGPPGPWGAVPDLSEILDPATLEEMFQPAVPVNRAEGSREWTGLGFFVFEREGRRYVGHTGSQKAFRSFFYVDPETGAGAVGVFNTVAGEGSFRPDTDGLRVQLREKLLDEIFPLFVAQGSSSEDGRPRPSEEASSPQDGAAGGPEPRED